MFQMSAANSLLTMLEGHITKGVGGSNVLALIFPDTRLLNGINPARHMTVPQKPGSRSTVQPLISTFLALPTFRLLLISSLTISTLIAC